MDTNDSKKPSMSILPFETFKKFTKEESYRLYEEYYNKSQQDALMKDLLLELLSSIKDTTKLLVERFPFFDKAEPKQNKIDNTNEQRMRYPNVREPYVLSSVTKNLVLGSSIVKRISTNSFPEDVSIHSYPGSKTEDKIEIVKKYKISTPLASLVLQDGTNTILKEKEKSVDEIIEGQRKLITLSQQIFRPEKIFMCEIPPLKSSIENSVVNKKVDEVNLLLQDLCHEFPNVELVPLCREIKNCPRMNDLYFDNIHFNYQIGLPFICNIMKRCVLPHSSNIPRTQPTGNRYRSIYSTYNNYMPRIQPTQSLFHSNYTTQNNYRTPPAYRYHPANTYFYMNG